MILITGATGNVGRKLVTALTAAGVPVRALVRDVTAAQQILGAGVELAEGDFLDRDSVLRAARGAERAFVLAPLSPRLAEFEMATVDAAVAAGVQHVVKLSTAGVVRVSPEGAPVEPRMYPLHRDSERFIESTGARYTHLRPGPFFQNLLGFAPAIVATDAFYGAWGDGAMPYIDAEDVAAAAARVLVEPGHEDRAYVLTGPRSITHADVAEQLTRCLGRRVRYADGPVAAAGAAMRARGLPDWLVGAMQEVMEHARAGVPMAATDDVERLLGRPPRSVETFLAENAAAFSAPAATAAA
jgi:uncharacterized protein YbjT (DUF2867 family)